MLKNHLRYIIEVGRELSRINPKGVIRSYRDLKILIPVLVFHTLCFLYPGVVLSGLEERHLSSKNDHLQRTGSKPYNVAYWTRNDRTRIIHEK
jgi:hypothetical protein